jgi:predicted GNAT family acetyltransferase
MESSSHDTCREVWEAMKIQHRCDGDQGEFFLEDHGKRLAEMTYSVSGPSTITIHRTGVSDALKGQGVGKKLVRTGVEYARKHRLKIVPLCPFVEAEFEKNVEYDDVRFRPPKKSKR